jgi:hypothetical protein
MPRLFLLPADKGRRAFFWTVMVFAASQPVLHLYLEWRRPEVQDPLYEIRLRSLQSRLTRSPGSPLVLALGSSRTKYGLWPAVMQGWPASDASRPVIYNFGINGAGHIRELMYFRRLLADGIRPDWLLVEIWPPLWAEKGYFAERRMVVGEDELHWRDVPLLYQYFRGERDVLAWAGRQLFPLRLHRSRLLWASARFLLSRKQVGTLAADRKDCDPDDDTGWFALPYGPNTPEESRQAIARNYEELSPLLQSLDIDPRSDTALREILEECRARGIGVAVFMMPEHSAVRGWYSPETRARVHSYLDSIQRDYHVPLIDTRDWVPDGSFADVCHMWRHGAVLFSERFGREVLQPLLNAKPRNARICPTEADRP